MENDVIIPAPLIQQFESQVPRSKALEIGAGNGNNALFLAKQGFSVTAVEVRKDLADMIKNRAKKNQVRLEIANENINDFTIEENQYSFISAMNSFNFLSKKEFYGVVEKIKKGLIRGGICVIALFTVEDPLFREIKTKAIIEDERDFHNNEGKKWYFPKPNELRELFEKDSEILFYVEAVIEDKKGHPGNPQPHKHAIARIAIKK